MLQEGNRWFGETSQKTVQVTAAATLTAGAVTIHETVPITTPTVTANETPVITPTVTVNETVSVTTRDTGTTT